MTRTALFFFIITSAGLSAAAYILGGFLSLSFAGILFGAFWAIGMMRHWKWSPAICLFGIYFLVVLGLLLGFSTALLTVSAFCALLAWDLADLSFRLRLAAPEDDTSGLQRRHLLTLIVVAFFGTAAVITAQTLRVKFAFEWMALLLLFAAWGVGRVVSGLLRREQ
jgi:hypothetical protein